MYLFVCLFVYYLHNWLVGITGYKRTRFSKPSIVPEFFPSMRFNTSRNSQLVWQQYDPDFPHGRFRHTPGFFRSIWHGSTCFLRRRVKWRSRFFRLFYLARFDILYIWKLQRLSSLWMAVDQQWTNKFQRHFQNWHDGYGRTHAKYWSVYFWFAQFLWRFV